MKDLIKFLSIAISTILIIGGVNNYSFASEAVFEADFFGNPNGSKELEVDIAIDATYLLARLDQGKQLKNEYKKWTENFPQWKVKLNAYKPSQERPVKLLEKLKANNAPDCTTVDSFQISLFEKHLQPMEPYFSKSELDDLFPNFRKIATDKNGHLLYWWYSTDVRVIYYFKDLMDSQPQTWKELEDSLIKAHKLHPKLIPLYVSARRYESTSNDWYAYLWQQGGKLIDDSGKPIFGDKDNLPKMVKALNFYKNMVDKNLISKSALTIEEIGDIVGGRKVIAWQTGSWEALRHLSYLKSLGNEKYIPQLAIVKQPSYNGKDYATSTGGITFAIFTKDKEKAKACAGFIKYIFAGPLNKITGDMPTVYTAYKKGIFAQPIYQKFKNIAISSGHTRPAKVIYPEVSVEIQGIISRIISGESFDLKKAVENSYKKVLRSHNRLMRK